MVHLDNVAVTMDVPSSPVLFFFVSSPRNSDGILSPLGSRPHHDIF